jgi:hypothetical protein
MPPSKLYNHFGSTPISTKLCTCFLSTNFPFAISVSLLKLVYDLAELFCVALSNQFRGCFFVWRFWNTKFTSLPVHQKLRLCEAKVLSLACNKEVINWVIIELLMIHDILLLTCTHRIVPGSTPKTTPSARLGTSSGGYLVGKLSDPSTTTSHGLDGENPFDKIPRALLEANSST